MEIYHFVTGPIDVNTYVCKDEETNEGFIVDPGGPSDKVIKAINQNAIDLKYIVLTHGHGDHIGGIADVQRNFPSVKIVANKKELEMLGDAELNSSVEMFPKGVTVKPDILVNDGDTMKVGNLELKFISTPGHTKGGMCILTENILFSGDTLFRYSVGRTDFYGGDYNALVKSIKNKLFLLPDDTIVLPGHDEQTTIGDEKKGNPFV